MATQADQRLLTADEFLRIIFEPDAKPELDEGIVRMMTGGTRAHSRVQGNLLALLAQRLRGSGCRPFGPDLAVQTSELSVRYPDIVVDCTGPEAGDDDLLARNPRVVIEVLSPGTARKDEGIKLREYRGLPTVDTVVLIDPLAELLRVLQRDESGKWPFVLRVERGDLALPSLEVTLPRMEIFARD